jgi:hypothetical protein
LGGAKRAMRAKVSLVLAGFGKFVLMTSAFCIAMTIAITGPPTPSETAGLSAVIDRAVRRFDSAALNFSFDLCRRATVIAHAAGLCAGADGPVVVRNDRLANRNEVAAVSQTLPASAREILPPETFDEIAQPSRHEELLGGSAATPRHVMRPARRAQSAARARANPARTPHVAPLGRNARIVAARARRTPPARVAHTARPHATAPPTRAARATPIAAPRAPPVAAPAVATAPSPAPPAATPAVESPPVHENPQPAPAPEEQANAPEEHADTPDPQSDASDKSAADAAYGDEEPPEGDKT